LSIRSSLAPHANILSDAYSGALLFIAFLAEMRHPWDFWKGLFVAQTFIAVVYIFFGAYVSFEVR